MSHTHTKHETKRVNVGSRRTAIILVDVQEQFFSQNESVCKEFPLFSHNVTRLLSKARSFKEQNDCIEIIHLHYDYDEKKSLFYDFCNDITNNEAKKQVLINNKAESFAIPNENEKVFIKYNYDGFYNTQLDNYLRSNNIDTIYFAGLFTSCCVLLTAYNAFIRGYKVYLIEDCCADLTKSIHDQTIQYNKQYMFKTLQIKHAMAKL